MFETENRGPVWSLKQRQQRISVFLSQHTNNGTHSKTNSHAKTNRRQTAWFLYASLKLKNWPQSVLMQLVKPDIFFQKLIPMRARGEKKSCHSWAAWLKRTTPRKQTWGQPYYSLTRTQVRSQKANNNIKEVKLLTEHFEGTVIRTERAPNWERMSDSLNWEWEVTNQEEQAKEGACVGTGRQQKHNPSSFFFWRCALNTESKLYKEGNTNTPLIPQFEANWEQWRKKQTLDMYDLLFMSLINPKILFCRFFFSQGTIKSNSGQSNSKTCALRSSDNNNDNK